MNSVSRCNKTKKKFEYLKTIILRQHASKQHEKSWEKFENTVLYYRSTGYQVLLMMHLLVFYWIGKSNIEVSAKIIS